MGTTGSDWGTAWLEVRRLARFIVYLEPVEEGGYVASVPAIPGCVTQGETREEALATAEDAIRGYVASLKKHGEPLPYGIDEAEVQTIKAKTD